MPQPKQQAKTAEKARTTTAPLVDVEGQATELVHVPKPDDPPAIWEALDRADEELVEQEIAGDLVETMAYEFEAGGQTARGLSYEGVNQAVRVINARKIGRITCPKDVRPLFRDTFDPDGNPIWECEVYALDEMVGTGAWGLADSRKYPERKNGTTYTDPHAKRKALSKAQRNAKGALIPLPVKIEIINGVTKAQIRKVSTPRQQHERQAGQRTSDRSRAAAATEPRRATPVTAGQVRLLAAKGKEVGLTTDSKEFKAIIGWVGGSIHLDRVEKTKVDQVVEAFADSDAVIAELTERAAQGDERAKWIVEHVFSDRPDAGQEQLGGDIS